MSVWRVRLAGFVVVFVASVFMASTASAQPAETPGYGRYQALIIGNSKYENIPPLKTPVLDARAMRDVLKQDYGFDHIRLLENVTRSEIVRALDDFRKTLTEQDNFLIYFAGHGVVDTGAQRGYWLPVDADSDSRDAWLSTADITDTLRAMRAKRVLVVADSCYSGSMTRDVVVVPRDKAEMDRASQKKARVVLTSGGEQPVSDSGGGDHSIFAKALLDVLKDNKKGIAPVSGLFHDINQLVRWNTEDQKPLYAPIQQAGHEGGDFIFVRPGSLVAALPPPPPPKLVVTKTPVANLGGLLVSAKVPDVEVWLEGDRIGQTTAGGALTVQNVPAGTYRLRARKAGYKDWESQIQVAVNQQREVLIDIEPLISQVAKAVGSLLLAAKIPDVEVWLEGDRVGQTVAGRSLAVQNLSPGTYRVRARKAGYQDWESQVQIAANQQREVLIDIEPLIRQVIHGALALKARIDGVEVWLEGDRLGETKSGRTLLKEQLAPGSYRIRAQKSGYKDWERKVEVVAGRPVEVDIDIEPLPLKPLPEPAVKQPEPQQPQPQPGGKTPRRRPDFPTFN